MTWSLTMQRGGNLVLSCAGSVFWQSHTHVPGSVLALRKDGNLVITDLHGRVHWSSRTAGSGPYTYLVGDAMSLQRLGRAKPVWEAHFPYRPTPQGCM